MSSRFMTHIKERAVPLAIWSVCVVLVVAGVALFETLAVPVAWIAFKYGGVLALGLSMYLIWTRKPWAQLRKERRERAKDRLMRMRVRRGTSMHESDLERLQLQSRGFIATGWHTMSLRVGLLVMLIAVMWMAAVTCINMNSRVIHNEVYALCMGGGMLLGAGSVLVMIYGAIILFATWSENSVHRETWRTMQTLREERFQGVTPGELSIASAPTDGGLTEHEEDP